jgi:RNA polymerase sigma-70 factor (ECF subfamily)
VPLVLYHFEDKSYRAIADLLGTSMAKVKTDIHRGRIALRRLLDDDDRTR